MILRMKPQRVQNRRQDGPFGPSTMAVGLTRRVLWLAVPLLLGLLLRLWFIAHAPQAAGDTLIYANIAQNWFHHGVYGFSPHDAPHPTLIRLPGYPLFLGLCFACFGAGNYHAVMLVQAVADLCTCVLVAKVAARCFGRMAGYAGLWLAALCPFTANYTAAPLTETLVLFTIALAMYTLLAWRLAGGGWNLWLVPLTVALAYSLLLRPDQGLLAAAILPAMLWPAGTGRHNGQRLAIVSVVLAGMLLPLVPWTARNWHTFHVVQPLAPRYATDPGELVPLGFQRWFRTWGVDFISNETAYWNYDGNDILLGDLPARAFDSPDQRQRTAALLDEYNQKDSATPALEARFNQLARERIAAAPMRYYVWLPLTRLADMLLRPRTALTNLPSDWWHWSRHAAASFVALSLALVNLAYLVLGGVGLGRALRPPTHSAADRRTDACRALLWSTVAFVALRCALLLTLDNAEPRYTLEFFPILFLWAAALWMSHSGAEAETLR
jgi:hypothetical protein